MYQKVTVIGNLGTDPETREVGGSTVTNFSLASNRKWTAKDGTKQSETTWFRVSVWGKQGENVQKYLGKGRQAMVEGRLSPDKETGGPRLWEGTDGSTRASYELTAENVVFLSGGDGRDRGQSDEAADDDFNQDIPF
jgi:single-strand DNA-binding protein